MSCQRTQSDQACPAQHSPPIHTAPLSTSSSTVWVKKITIHPLWLSDIFHKRLRILNQFFTHLLYVPIYARLQIFIRLSQILTKLCHIKRDYLVHIICSKCPPLAETHAFRRLQKSLLAFIMSTNMLDMTWRQQWLHLFRKQTYHLGKMSENRGGGIFFDSHCRTSSSSSSSMSQHNNILTCPLQPRHWCNHVSWNGPTNPLPLPPLPSPPDSLLAFS